VNLLRRYNPEEASKAVMVLPFDQQRLLFRRLPLDLAAPEIGTSRPRTVPHEGGSLIEWQVKPPA
jgi:hypothetical protein